MIALLIIFLASSILFGYKWYETACRLRIEKNIRNELEESYAKQSDLVDRIRKDMADLAAEASAVVYQEKTRHKKGQRKRHKKPNGGR